MRTDHAAKIDQIEGMLSSGVLTIESEGERITYRSTSDMLKALAYHRGALVQAGSTRGIGSTLAVFERD